MNKILNLFRYFYLLKIKLKKTMRKPLTLNILKSTITFTLFVIPMLIFGQGQAIKAKSDFWEKVHFGGGFGLSIGSGYSDITLAPSAIYNFNKYVSAGVGLQGSYVSSRNYFTSTHYGGSLISLFNIVDEVQLSVEVEEVRINNKYESLNGNYNHDFWNTSIFLGGGYRSGNVVIGARYNILQSTNKDVYNDALMPFVRVYF